jgi:hypothetical protein
MRAKFDAHCRASRDYERYLESPNSLWGVALGHYLSVTKKQPRLRKILAIHCSACAAAPGEKCELNAGQPRTEPHLHRRFVAEPARFQSSHVLGGLADAPDLCGAALFDGLYLNSRPVAPSNAALGRVPGGLVFARLASPKPSNHPKLVHWKSLNVGLRLPAGATLSLTPHARRTLRHVRHPR